MKIINILITVLIFTGLIGAVASSVTDKTNTFTQSETFARPESVPTVYDLDGYEIDSITSVSNGTSTVSPSNYTLIINDGDNKINFTANVIGGTSYIVTYDYKKFGNLSGTSAIMFGLIPLLIVVGFVSKLIKGNAK